MQSPDDRYAEVLGLRTRYWAVGQGRPVLLIHGLAASCEYWQYNIQALSEHRRVYVLDLPGFGLSEKRIPEFSLSFAARFVMAFLEVQGVNRACVAGNSLGGAVALQFAVDYQESLERLILVSSAGLGPDLGLAFRVLLVPGVGELLVALRRMPWAMALEQRSVVYDPRSIDDAFIKRMVELASLPKAGEALLQVARYGIDFGGQRMSLLRPLLERLPTICAPTLIIWGAQDKVVPPSHSRIAQGLIGDSRLVVLQGCGHLPQVEKPEEFNRAVLDFLAQCPEMA